MERQPTIVVLARLASVTVVLAAAAGCGGAETASKAAPVKPRPSKAAFGAIWRPSSRARGEICWPKALRRWNGGETTAGVGWVRPVTAGVSSPITIWGLLSSVGSSQARSGPEAGRSFEIAVSAGSPARVMPGSRRRWGRLRSHRPARWSCWTSQREWRRAAAWAGDGRVRRRLAGCCGRRRLRGGGFTGRRFHASRCGPNFCPNVSAVQVG